ncbi:MAG: hypothetical protein HYV09_40990 [Deltaproteobacteria bacterium]|nr:hypothetical protein [Deltaproteobacteria bacterium]
MDDDALMRLRSLSWDSPHEERRRAIAAGEREVPEALAAGQWDAVVDLASALADAYLDLDGDADEITRRREWSAVALDAARALEGEDGGLATIAALERLGRASLPLDHTGADEARALFVAALEMAERLHGDDAPELFDLLLLVAESMTGSASDEAIEHARRALSVAERHDLDPTAALVELATALLDAGRAHDAIAHAERAMRGADDTARAVHMIPQLLAIAYEDVGRTDDALHMREEHVRLADDDDEREIARGFLMESLVRAGREPRSASRSKLD